MYHSGLHCSLLELVVLGNPESGSLGALAVYLLISNIESMIRLPPSIFLSLPPFFPSSLSHFFPTVLFQTETTVPLC